MLSITSFCFSPVQENTYLLYNEEGQCCIIDPGCYFPAEQSELKAAVEKTGLKPVLLLNTHCHLDHVFGNKFVHDTWGLSLHIHPLEKPLLDYAPVSGKLWQLPFEGYEGPLVYLNAGDIIQIGEEQLKVIFTPGHSPGSVSFYHKAGGFIIGGDVLFSGSVGRTDLPGASFEVLENSIRTQFYTLPNETIVYSGHGEATSVGKEKRSNGFVREG